MQPTFDKKKNKIIKHLFTKPKNGKVIPKKYKYPMMLSIYTRLHPSETLFK